MGDANGELVIEMDRRKGLLKRDGQTKMLVKERWTDGQTKILVKQ